MKILSNDDLKDKGVSLSEAHSSLVINFSSKQFRRKCDIPKKFKEKALKECAKIEGEGKESFITETSFSYTIWEEEKTFSTPLNNQRKLPVKNSQVSFTNQGIEDSLVENIEALERKEIVNPPYSSPKSLKKNYQVRELNISKYSNRKQHTSFSEQLKQASESKNLGDTLSTIDESVVRYRGLTVTPSTAVQEVEEKPVSSKKRKRVKTYRGVVYEF